MKLKRSRTISVFFLVSFFISISTNICVASFYTPQQTISSYTKDHLHLNETAVTTAISDLLFEENENENENELDLDLSLILIPFFLETFSCSTIQDAFDHPSISVVPTEQPIYLQIANIRI